MPPSVTAVERVEMIRDGGSLRATYAAADGLSYTLEFPIKLQGWERLGYRPPFLGKLVIIKRDGIRVGHNYENAVELSWPEAKALLESMRGLVDHSDTSQHQRFEQMLYVADHEGALPAF